MKFPKTKRIENRKLLDKITEQPCCVCGAMPPSDPHHLSTKGSGGDDTEDNLIPLCRMHHVMIHAEGSKMLEKHPHVKELLIEMGRRDVIDKAGRVSY